MSKYEKETLKDIATRLRISNPRKWKSLTEQQRVSVTRTYYRIRDIDYRDIGYLLREHANERKQFYFLILGVLIGIFAVPISSALFRHLPTETIWDDVRTVLLFSLLIGWIFIQFTKASAEFLGDENTLERLLEMEEKINAEPTE